MFAADPRGRARGVTRFLSEHGKLRDRWRRTDVIKMLALEFANFAKMLADLIFQRFKILEKEGVRCDQNVGSRVCQICQK